jgi:hypothetical protein
LARRGTLGSARNRRMVVTQSGTKLARSRSSPGGRRRAKTAGAPRSPPSARRPAAARATSHSYPTPRHRRVVQQPPCRSLTCRSDRTAAVARARAQRSDVIVHVIPPGATRPDRSALAGRPTRGELQGQHSPARRGRSAPVLHLLSCQERATTPRPSRHCPAAASA